MAPKQAKPGRYLVDIHGTANPEDSEYYVINVVHDEIARKALRYLVRSYEMQVRSDQTSVKAQELQALLDRVDAGERGWNPPGSPKECKPERFTVTCRGDLDPPDSEYYVINVVIDWVARAGLWFIARHYREAELESKAIELEKLLRETDEACRQNIEAKNAPKKKVGRPKSAKPKR